MDALQFLRKLFLFLIPLAIVLGFPLVVLYRSGELLPDNTILARHLSTSTPVIVGLAYSNPTPYFDLQSVLIVKPEVLFIGSSRIQEMRSTFFSPTTTEYVASQAAQKIGQFMPFLQNLPTSTYPKVMVMDLDQKFFDPNYDSLAPDNINELLTQGVPMTDVLGDWSLVYKDFEKKNFTLENVLHPSSTAIGLLAMVQGVGFRSDGSEAMGIQLHPPMPDAGSLSDIANDVGDWKYSATISQGALQVLDTFLAACKARNIYVIGFVPPLSPTIYAKVTSLPNQYGYIAAMSPSIGPIFAKYGFPFHNFTNPSSGGLTAEDMQDSIHTTERGSLILFIKMAREDKILQEYADPNLLQQKLNATTKETDIL